MPDELMALIFDVDGTLADTERDAHRVAFNRAFSGQGLDWHWSVERYGELLKVTGGKERIRHYMEQESLIPPVSGDPDVFVRRLHQDKTDAYVSLIGSGQVSLRPGIARLIKEAREQGVRLAIATTTTMDNVTVLLESTLGPDAPGWFEVIGAGDVVPYKKPAPDIYRYVLQKLDLEPRFCLAFEDSENGVLSARGAGLRTIVTANGYTLGHDFTSSELVLDHLGEEDQPCRVLGGHWTGRCLMDMQALRAVHAGAGTV